MKYYTVSQSGSRNSQYGKPRSEETKEKIRQSLLKRKNKVLMLD